MSQLNLKPTHAAVKNYYNVLNQFGQLYVDHEMAVRSAFQYLLATTGRKLKLTLVPEFEIKRKNSSIRVDGALIDEFHLSHNQTIDRKLVIGALLFGIGWGISGYCPGPAIAALAEPNWETWIFLPAMLLGLIVQQMVSRNR